ncbi:hypothetical protein COOONC_01045 [Cooperia oncophora]
MILCGAVLPAVFAIALTCQPINMVAMNEPTMALEPMAKTFVVPPANLTNPGYEDRPSPPPEFVYETYPPSTVQLLSPTTAPTTKRTSLLPSSKRTLYPRTETTFSDDFTVKWTCSSAMVQIETTHPWDPDRTKIHHDLLNRNLLLLQHHSGTNLREFGSVLRKIAKVESGDRLVFGELFFLPKIAQPCDALREFVRKAVSWSKDIPRAVVACRCETAVEIYKVKEQDYTTFHIL